MCVKGKVPIVPLNCAAKKVWTWIYGNFAAMSYGSGQNLEKQKQKQKQKQKTSTAISVLHLMTNF